MDTVTLIQLLDWLPKTTCSGTVQYRAEGEVIIKTEQHHQHTVYTWTLLTVWLFEDK